MKYQCSKCKSPVSKEDIYCRRCGAKLVWKKQSFQKIEKRKFGQEKKEKKINKVKYGKFSRVSLILGAIALATTFIGFLISGLYSQAYVGRYNLMNDLYFALMICVPSFTFGIPAVIFGSISLKRTAYRGGSIAGIVMGAFVLMIFSTCAFIFTFGSLIQE